MPRKLKVRHVKSASGHKADQGRTVRALGFRRLNQTLEIVDTPQIRGMLFKVRHLVVVEETG